ncbi:DMT family transporter [Oceanospirillum maris]|uniref:DMT family transporter n=1 Tax=Oceanospirillum maris TaxID=64977 RepID=UPI00040BFCFD|nr:DMT family transporter [Oceanospirillum maris]
MAPRYMAGMALLLAMILWASSFIALKYAFQWYPPEWVIFGRMLIAALCFLPFWKWLNPGPIPRKDKVWLLLLAFAEPGLYFIFESIALQNTSASQAGMITALLPMLVAIGAAFWLKERVSAWTVVGFGLAIMGGVLLSTSSTASDSAPNPEFGNLMELLAMVCAAVYTLILKKLSDRYSTWFITAFQSFFGTVFFLPLALSAEGEMVFHQEGVLSVLYLGVLITLGAYGLYNWSVQQIQATHASAYTNLIPVFTVIMAFLILDERFTQGQVIASFLVIAGLALSQIPERKTSNLTPPENVPPEAG